MGGGIVMKIMEKLLVTTAPNALREIKMKFWKRFLCKARKCIKQCAAVRDSFADDKEMVEYFMKLMEKE